MSNLNSEINELIAQLPKHQLEELRTLFQDEDFESKVVKRILPKDRVHEAEVRISCRLCGTVKKTIFKSVTDAHSTMETPTCEKCREVLLSKSVEELVALCIKVASGEFRAVEEAKINYKKEEDHEDEGKGISEAISEGD